MNRPSELAAPAAAAAVVLTAVLGGGFFPLPRLVVGGALIAVWVIGAMGARGSLDRTEQLLAGLLAWGVFSAVWVGSAPLAAKEALTIWFAALALFMISRRGTAASRRRAMAVMTAGAAVIAAGIVVEALGAGLRVGGFLENPNVAAGLMVPTLPVGWWVLDGRPRWRWIWVSLVVAGVLCTGSRAGLLASLVAVGVLLPQGRIRLAGLLTGSALAASVLVWRFVSQPDVLAWHRISIWWAVLKIWLTRPLTGVGPGSLVEAAGPARILHPEEIGRYQFVVGYAESTPLAVLVQLGLVGAVLSGLAMYSWWTAEWGEINPNRPELVSSFLAVLVLGAFHDFLTIDPVLWWWAVLFGCTAGGSPRANPAAGTVSSRWIAAILMIWLTAWGIVGPALARRVLATGPPESDHVVRVLRIEPWLSIAPAARVGVLLAADDPWTWVIAGEALHWARTAVDVHPGRARLWADLGRAHLRILSDLGGTQHDKIGARNALNRACELDPHVPWNWLERARLEWMIGDLNEAVRMTKHALAQEPQAVRGWLLLSRLELESGRRGEAILALKNAEDRLDLAQRSGLSEYDLDLLAVSKSTLESLRYELDQTQVGEP